MRKLIAAAFCAAAFGASAETTNTVTAPPRIVVTATRRAAPIRSVAKNPSVISSEDIAAGHYSSIPEALQKKAGIFVRNTSDNPSQAKVNLRGFGGDFPHGKTLVLLNGRTLNNMDMAGINWAQVPMQAVDRIEVIRGPNSVLYGDHAVGGVINIITKEPSDIPLTTLTASIASYETYEQSVTTSGKLDGLGYIASLEHQSSDGYRDRSKYDTLSGSLRLNGNINESIRAYAEISTVKEQHQLPGSLSKAEVQQNRQQSNTTDDFATEESFTLQAGIEATLTDELLFNLDAGLTKKDIEADYPSNWTPSYYNYKINTYTLSPKFTLLTPIAGMNNELLFGVDLSREQLNSQKYDDPNRSIIHTDTKITKQTLGGYIADTLSLTDKILLSGGYRLEKNKVAAVHKETFFPFSDSETHREDAWQSAITWLPTDTLKLFAGIDRTYRYPFVDEQAIYSGWGNAFNKDLKPETGINYEIGVEYTPISNLVLQATLFRTDMEDEIAWGNGKNENLDETTHRGLEISAAYKTSTFALDAFYTWMQSEFTAGSDKGNEIPWVPQNNLDVNLALFLTDAMTLNTHMSYVGARFQSGDNLNSGANKQSEYAIFDLLLQYDLPIQKADVTVFAGIDNLFATDYNSLVWWDGYYPAPERTYKAGLSVTF